MISAFWSNTIWYILLGISTVVVMIFVFYKAENRKHILALFLIMSGFTFSIEVIVYCFLRAYDYYPMIIPQSPIDDGLAGNLFSQFSITSTALLVGILDLKYYWIFIFAGIYGIIEELFLMLGVYSHNWYRTWITIIGFVVLLGIMKKMFKDSSMYTRPILRFISMFFALFTLHMILIWWLILLSGIVGITFNYFADPMINYTFISFMNLFVLSTLCIIIYFFISKRWLKAAGILALYGAIYFAEKFNIIYIKEGRFFIIATINIFGMYLFVNILDKLFKKAGI
jgi:hypothetical protein